MDTLIYTFSCSLYAMNFLNLYTTSTNIKYLNKTSTNIKYLNKYLSRI